MTPAKDMYREHILELFRNPTNFGTLATATHTHRIHNHVCGDDITMQLDVRNGVIQNVKFKGSGCAISVASAALITEAVKGKRVDEVMQYTKETVLALLHIPVSPVRLKCALLGLEAIHKALGEHNESR